MQQESVGSVKFLAEAGKDFLFFYPKKLNPTLKVLDGSMWFEKDTVKGYGFRASSSIEALEWLRANLGPLSLSPEVFHWIKEAESITPIKPIDGLPLFDFQREAVGFLMDRDRAMLSLSPGLGKTITSITAASLRGIRKVLVVAPASLLYMWKAELDKWSKHLPMKIRAIIWHGKKGQEEINTASTGFMDAVWIITNPETITRRKKAFNRKLFELVILDESILYKNRDSQRSKTVKELASTIPAIWELTGAPATRMLDDLWPQFNILKPRAYSSLWRFRREYCVVSGNEWASTVTANKLGAEETIKKRFRDIYFARNQDEVLDLPDWLFEEIDIPMVPYQEKAYKELQNQLMTQLRVEGIPTYATITVDSHLTKVLRLIQLASNPLLLGGEDKSGKWDQIESLMQLYEPPYLFWTTFKITNEEIAKKISTLGLRAAKMSGDTAVQDRQSIVDHFQAGKLDAIVLNQSVGSFGLTLTEAKTSFYLERNFDGNFFQSLHRVRRIGSRHSVNVLFLRSVFANGRPTVDHLVHNMLDYRVEMIQKLTVGMIHDIAKE